MARRSNLRKTIELSDPTDWDRFENPLSWVFWEEELTITDIGQQGTGEATEISKPDFLKKSQSDRHQKSTIRITYRGTPFDQFPMLRLDEDRIRMIKPSVNQSTGDAFMNSYEAHLSQIISTSDFTDLVDSVISLNITKD